MRKFLLLGAAFVTLATPALATRRIPIVAPYRAGQAQGNLVAVRGRADIRPDPSFQGTDVRLIDENGRVSFIGFIPSLNAYAFPNLAGLNGKIVVMYGIIELYEGLPATQLIYPDQLRAD